MYKHSVTCGKVGITNFAFFGRDPSHYMYIKGHDYESCLLCCKTYFQHIVFPPFWGLFFSTWYGWSLEAMVYFCILVTLKGQGQGHSIKFKVRFLKFSKWSEKSSERFWRCKYVNFVHDLHLITEGHA